MKREGRQHGMVRTHCILPSTTLSPVVKAIPLVSGAPPTAGIFTRVSSKPTNHSKFTGKCRRPRCSSCHLHPSSKSKDKTKGSSKLRPDLGCGGPSLKLDGYSSSKVLDELHDYNHLQNHGGEEEDNVEYHGGEEEDNVECHDNGCDLDQRITRSNRSTVHQDENEDDDMGGFYDVQLAWEPLDGEEGWSLVGEM